MQLPIYIDGERVGNLTLRRQGNQIRAEARLRDMGRVLRLSIYGRDAVYLGIPEPRDGGMYLCRMLRRVPEGARYCAERPMEEETKKPAPEKEPEPAATPVQRRLHVVWRGGKPHYF